MNIEYHANDANLRYLSIEDCVQRVPARHFHRDHVAYEESVNEASGKEDVLHFQLLSEQLNVLNQVHNEGNYEASGKIFLLDVLCRTRRQT
jgi:hypothetical protein